MSHRPKCEPDGLRLRLADLRGAFLWLRLLTGDLFGFIKRRRESRADSDLMAVFGFLIGVSGLRGFALAVPPARICFILKT